MNRIQVACFSLIASAFILTGLLITQLGSHGLESTANAEMVLAQRNFTIMTAETRQDEEALFIMDNSSGSLLIYTLDLTQGRLELNRAIDMNRVFAGGERGTSRGTTRGGGR